MLSSDFKLTTKEPLSKMVAKYNQIHPMPAS